MSSFALKSPVLDAPEGHFLRKCYGNMENT
jgi:hypothetical protein